MSTPSWDLFIVIFFAVITGYGFILQKEKTAATLISTYVALVVTTVWGQTIFDLLTGNTVLFNQVWFRTNANPFVIKTIIFSLFIVLLALKAEYISTRAGAVGSSIVLFLYSFLNAGLIISVVISFMDEVSRDLLVSQSHIADLIFKYHEWWIILPAIVLIIAGFKRKSPYQEIP